MALKRVRQDADNGCFVACIATLMGKSYAQAFRLVHPDKYIGYWNHGVPFLDEKMIAEHLQKIGLKAKPSKLRKISSLFRHAKKPALLIVRWEKNKPDCHALVYDPKTKSFIDPVFYVPLRPKTYEKRLVSIFYVETI